jgi:hypothetical protein
MIYYIDKIVEWLDLTIEIHFALKDGRQAGGGEIMWDQSSQ